MSSLDRFQDRDICILGLGYVGLTLATTMADVGFRVHGVEIRDEVLKLLDSNEPHFHEPGLQEQLRRVKSVGRLTYSKHIPSGINSRVFIITVGTPLGKDGRTRTDMIENVTREIASHLKENDIVILRSTVKLGTTRNLVLPILKEKGVAFHLGFCPERTLEGKALRELRELPQIVGGIDFDSTVRAAQIFQFVTPTTVRVSDLETAEMIKMVDNAARDVLFAYSNEIAKACDAVGVSAMEVIGAGKLGYPRTNLPLPGPVGGPCLEKDPYILAEGLASYGMRPEMTLSGRKLNEETTVRAADFLAKTLREAKMPSRPKFAMLGLAFKGVPATDDLRGTTAIPFIRRMKEHFPDAEYLGYDAVVSAEGIASLGLRPSASINEAMQGATLTVILNNHTAFSSMPLFDCAQRMTTPGFIYDFWNNFQLRDMMMPSGVSYIALGSHGKAVRG